MVDPHILAQLCADIYDAPDAHPWLNYWTKDDVVVGHIRIGDVDVLVLRGSVTAIDWMRDCEAWPGKHPQLGYVHSGFMSGMDDVFAETRAVVGTNLVITGHSLGGARARLLAALYVANNLPVQQVTVFGSPRPGFLQVSTLIRRVPIHTSYRNRNDPVPLVPTIFPEWQHPEPWIQVDSPLADDVLEGAHGHAIHLYVKALAP